MREQKASTETLAHEYLDLRLPLREIAQRHGYANSASVSKIIQLRGIPLRGRKGLSHFYRPPHKLPGEVLSGEAWQVVCGGLLGDGHLTPNTRRNSAYDSCHTETDREYVLWLAERLEPWTSRVSTYPPGRTAYSDLSTVKVTTIAHPEFSALRSVFYPSGTKIVPESLLSSMGRLALAVWIMDDGCYNRSNKAIQISSQGFTVEDQGLLVGWLSTFGIDAHLVRCRGGYGRLIHLNRAGTQAASDLISPIVPACMYRKLGW